MCRAAHLTKLSAAAKKFVKTLQKGAAQLLHHEHYAAGSCFKSSETFKLKQIYGCFQFWVSAVLTQHERFFRVGAKVG